MASVESDQARLPARRFRDLAHRMMFHHSGTFESSSRR
jgi:hypothetical protein